MRAPCAADHFEGANTQRQLNILGNEEKKNAEHIEAEERKTEMKTNHVE